MLNKTTEDTCTNLTKLRIILIYKRNKAAMFVKISPLFFYTRH